MTKTFTMKLNEIQPSQLFISSEKLSNIMQSLNNLKPEQMEPIPMKKLGQDVIFVDGHTRAFAAFLRGFSEVLVYWEDEELDWDAYEVCVKWCKDEGIRTIADLKNKIVSPEDYETLWLERCEKMQQDLQKRQNQNR